MKRISVVTGNGPVLVSPCGNCNIISIKPQAGTGLTHNQLISFRQKEYTLPLKNPVDMLCDCSDNRIDIHCYRKILRKCVQGSGLLLPDLGCICMFMCTGDEQADESAHDNHTGKCN